VPVSSSRPWRPAAVPRACDQVDVIVGSRLRRRQPLSRTSRPAPLRACLPASPCRQFARRWNRMLRKLGIDHFHAADFYGVFCARSLYARSGKPKFCYNFLGLQLTYVEGDTVMPPGQHQVRMEELRVRRRWPREGRDGLNLCRRQEDGGRATSSRPNRSPLAKNRWTSATKPDRCPTDYPGNHGSARHAFGVSPGVPAVLIASRPGWDALRIPTSARLPRLLAYRRCRDKGPTLHS
jgi:hypothetical protein